MVLSTVEGDKDPPFLTSQSPPLTLTLLVTAPQGRGDYCPHFRAKESKVQAMRKYECRTGHPGGVTTFSVLLGQTFCSLGPLGRAGAL